MGIKFKIPALVIIFWAVSISRSGADTLYLKNGRDIEGIVKQEDDNTVELEVGIGLVKFRRSEIERIEKAPLYDNLDLKEEWRRKKIKDEQNRRIVAEEERLKEERSPKEVAVQRESGHIIVNALLNGEVNATLLVDTGASVIVLSRTMGEKLDLENTMTRTAGKGVPKVELILADGRKVQAQYVLLKSVTIEGVEAYNVEAAILLEDNNTAIMFDGVLGMSFLKRYNFKFDNSQGKLILEKI